MDEVAGVSAFHKKASFLKLILVPFLVISFFAQFYSNSFLMAFLVDNSAAVELARKTGKSDSPEINKVLRDSRMFTKTVGGKIGVSQKKDQNSVQVSANLWSTSFRLLSMILLYFWLRPFFRYIKTGEETLKKSATSRYNNFYLGIFSYFLLTHIIWFVSSTFQVCLPADLPSAVS